MRARIKVVSRVAYYACAVRGRAASHAVGDRAHADSRVGNALSGGECRVEGKPRLALVAEARQVIARTAIQRAELAIIARGHEVALGALETVGSPR